MRPLGPNLVLMICPCWPPRNRGTPPISTPPNSTYHDTAEHGVAPEEAAKDEAAAWQLETLCALRSYWLWLNKGIDLLHYFSAYEDKAMGMGLLPPNLKNLSEESRFDEVATPPMRAVRNLTRAFEWGAPLKGVQTLSADVVPLGDTGKVFDGKAPLRHSEVYAFQPFQVSERRHIVAVYVATHDALRPMPEEHYRLTIRGLAGVPRAARLYDPTADRSFQANFMPRGPGTVEVEVPGTDSPLLLIFEG